MVHYDSIPTVIYGRFVLSPLPFEIVFVFLCCQNLAVYEPFIDISWSHVKVHKCWISSKFAISAMNSHLFILTSFLTFEHFIMQEISDWKCCCEKDSQVV